MHLSSERAFPCLSFVHFQANKPNRHFKNIKDDEEWSNIQTGAFLVVDSASFASYTTNSYSPATSQVIPGDFSGFLLAVDPDFDPQEGISRPDESPGFNGQMRILGSLVWSDLYSLLASQTSELEDYWPLASEHPNMVYVGPTIPWQRFIWQKHSEMRWILLRAVIDHVKLNPGMPVTSAMTSSTAVESTAAPPAPSMPSPTPPAERSLVDNALRALFLTEFQRDMRRQGQWQVATMANEMLRLQPGEQPDTRRMRQMVHAEEQRREQRRRDGLPEEEDSSEEDLPDFPWQ
jgi:hypothetical protein